ncbi:MAG: acyltransferase [Rhizobacter sp.]
MAGPNAHRTIGLDTLRALAIALVFMYHYMVFVSGTPTFGWASVVGWAGVDLFFVLSGYLIGNQLFAGITRGERLSLKAFYARRGLRTWPAFWVVLAAYFLFPAFMGGKAPPPLWRFLTFTQNIDLQPGTAFSHAWSLCIEEQFYLVLPLALLLAWRVGTKRSQAWTLLGALVLGGVIARAVLWSLYGREDFGQGERYYPSVYYSTLCRIDEFLPGVAVALLKNFHTTLWQRLMRHGQALLGAGVAASLLLMYGALNFYYIDNYGYGFFMSAFGYSLIAAAFSLLVMAALSPNSWLHRLRIPGVHQLAVWSYSIYLSHKAVCFVIRGHAKEFAWSPGTALAVTTVVSLLVGAVLHWLVEAPFMALRDRHVGSNFRTGPTLAAAAPSGLAD